MNDKVNTTEAQQVTMAKGQMLSGETESPKPEASPGEEHSSGAMSISIAFPRETHMSGEISEDKSLFDHIRC